MSGKDANGNISLRSAIMAANNLVGADSITLPEGNYNLAIPPGATNYDSNGDLGVLDDLTISGIGDVVIDAHGLDRVFYVNAVVTISNVTIRGGRAGFGAGIANAGTLTLNGVTVTDNVAVGGDGAAGANGAAGQDGSDGTKGVAGAGGGIYNYNGALLTLNRSTISNNMAIGGAGGRGGAGGTGGKHGGWGGGGGPAFGGGIRSGLEGELTIIDSAISGNTARGGVGGEGGPGSAGVNGVNGDDRGYGAIGADGGPGGNGGDGFPGGRGGNAYGGGVFTLAQATIRGTVIANNSALGGNGARNGAPGAGGKGGNGGTVNDAYYGATAGNGGDGGDGGGAGNAQPGGIGGSSHGGGVYTEHDLRIEISTIVGNTALAGATSATQLNAVPGGNGGRGGNGGDSTGRNYLGIGGIGGDGGDGGDGGRGAVAFAWTEVARGLGGGVSGADHSPSYGMRLLESCTIVGNTAGWQPHLGSSPTPGPGGSAGFGGWLGFGSDTNGDEGSSGIAGEKGYAEPTPGATSRGGAVFDDPTNRILLHNSIFAKNKATTEPNGGNPEPGFNLLLVGDNAANDPKLGPLQDNGGPTPTMAPLDGSPAIGAGDPALVGTTDQRGVVRYAPIDIGAFEFSTLATTDDEAITREDTLLTAEAPGLLENDIEPEGAPLTASLVLQALHGVATVNEDGSFQYLPERDFNGVDSFTYVAGNGTKFSRETTVAILVLRANDPPSCTIGPPQSTTDESGAQRVPGWITNCSSGPTDESSQSFSVTISTDNPLLFAALPALDASGALTYTPAPNASGTTTVTVAVKDNGGTMAGGVDASFTTLSFEIAKPHPWHNMKRDVDVDDDGKGVGGDALAIINYINSELPTKLALDVEVGGPFGFLDVTGDNVVAADDALTVINAINAEEGEGEEEAGQRSEVGDQRSDVGRQESGASAQETIGIEALIGMLAEEQLAGRRKGK